MQEEIEHKTVNLAISTTKLSARTLLRGMQFLLRQYDKHASQGKQSMKRLVRQNRGVTNVEIQKTGIKDFDRYGQFSRIPMKLSLTSRPLTLCRKSVGMSDATRTAGAKQLPSRVCSIAPIAAARCMSTVPTTASVFLNIPVPNTAKSQLESSARHSTVSMKMWYCHLFPKC